MNTRIAITDDHQMVLEGVVAMLKGLDGIEVVGTYNSAQETLDNIQKDEATLLLLDVNLPDINGIDLAKMLLKDQPELKIIALTNFEDISFVKRMLKNGVHGYLLKNTDREELSKAIQTVQGGELFLQSDIHKRLLNQVSSKGTFDNGLQPKLTRRETEVLQAIAEELTTQQISEKLFISPKTVETHRMNIMSKLGAKNSVGIIKIAMEKELL